MLAIMGLLTLVVLLALIMTKKVYTMVALVVVPVVAALILQFMHRLPAKQNLGTLVTTGLKNIAPTGVMFIFAILFFAILSDAGAFDPIIKRIIKGVGGDPVKIALGTVALAGLVHLDGSGAVTFLVAIPALLPIYKAMRMRNTTLATLVALSAGTMNMLPWGGPTLRAITALNSSVAALYLPMVVPQVAGMVAVFAIAIILGRAERKRIAGLPAVDDADMASTAAQAADATAEASAAEVALKRPKLFWFNMALIVATLAIMLTNTLPPAVAFMIACCIALIVNYPKVSEQRERIDAHAKEALLMASMLFAAGAFIGIMEGSGMLKAMASALASIIPTAIGPFLPILVGVLSVPLSLVFDPDSYYFGVMPVIAQAAGAMGVDPLLIGRASIVGQMTVGFPISPLTGSTFLLIGLAGVDLGEHQKKTIGWAFCVSIVMLVVAVLVGAIHF